MIIFITDKQVRQNFKKFGMKTIDTAVVEVINKALFDFVSKKLEKVIKKNKSIQKLDAVHFQTGGRVLMPSEYFGVQSNHYVSPLTNNGVEMGVQESWIRPPMDILRPHDGGAIEDEMFSVPLKAVKGVCAEALNNSGSTSINVSLSASVFRELKTQFDCFMTDVMLTILKKVKKDKAVSKADVVKVLAINRFAKRL